MLSFTFMFAIFALYSNVQQHCKIVRPQLLVHQSAKLTSLVFTDL